MMGLYILRKLFLLAYYIQFTHMVVLYVFIIRSSFFSESKNINGDHSCQVSNHLMYENSGKPDIPRKEEM